ncbi:odorant receptor 2a-like isoform X2 [Cylas formicarius]|uniref:odorant receptor 2a-like isoform X2 n=1 Tax=Cylas formicarius TaxID=197179 RepID=UPI002958D5EF|nr:odorant receptor 2a-like isoform X2 [Cylas formicarius]
MTVDYPDEFFIAVKLCSTFVGLGLPSRNPNEILRIVYALYKSCLFLLAIIFMICELITFREAFGDTQMLVSQIGMMFTHVVGLLKLSILILKRKQIELIQRKLQNREFYYKTLGNFQPGSKMRRESFVGISAHISTYLIVRKNAVDDQFIANVTCESLLPYYYYYPFDMSTVTGCYYSLTYMDICLDIFAWYIATSDMLFVGSLHLLKTQLDILGEAIINIRRRCLDALGMRTSFEIFKDEWHPDLENTMYNELTHCTKHLMTLLDVRNDVEEIFTFVTLAQTIASLLIFASCLYVAARVPMTSPNFFSQLEYFCAVLIQFSIYCWFGNQITRASESITSALYSANWFGSSRRFKKSMVLTMTRMQRPLYLSIGKFTPLALSTLLGVVRGSFSYFTVFQSVGDVEQLE